MKRFELVLSMVFLAASLWAPASQAATLHVPTDYSTIQQAIDAAVNGDTVLVGPGMYVENIDFKGKAITVKSSDGAEQTVIDGGNPPDPDFGSVVTFSSGEGKDSLLQGFTITNGKGTYFFHGWWAWCGGGILCASSSPTIMNNTISKNSAVEGGGIFCSSSSPTIMNNVVSANSAICGSGIFCSASSPTITNNTISENLSGGICCVGFSSPTITNNIISENQADWGSGGGISCSGSSPTITNNVIMGNLSKDSSHSGPAGGGILIYSGSSSLTITNNIISENRAMGAYNAGGILIASWQDASLTIKDNIITGNYGLCNISAGGIMFYNCWGGSLNIMNNIITGNFGAWGCGGIGCYEASPILVNNTVTNNIGGGVYNFSSSSPSITNSILWGNDGGQITGGNPLVTHCNVQGGYPGTGNIDSDPLFVELGYWNDNGTPGDPYDDIWIKGDYHLTFNSPCRGSGNSAASGLPDTDFEGDPRIAYGTVDMGADEFYTHLYFTGDATPGGTVEVKLTGLPGTGPVFLCVGSGVLDVPISTQYGYWRLDFPLLLMLGMGSMASPEGVSVQPYVFDPGFPSMDLPMQALIGMELTNFCVMSVK